MPDPRERAARRKPGEPYLPPGEHFDLLSAPPGVSFSHRNISPPAPLYITLDDFFYVEVHNTSSSPLVGIVMRVLLPSGQIKTTSQQVPLNQAGVFTSATFNMVEGFLLGVSAAPQGFNVRRGQVWVRLAIARGSLAGLLGAQILIQDYVETHYAASWPGGHFSSEVDGLGVVRSIVGTQPAAGGEISETVPTGRRWRLQTVNFGLTTSAAAGNRQVLFILDDGVSSSYLAPALSVQAASLTVGYAFAPGCSPIATTGGRAVCPIPSPAIMSAGWRFRTSTNAKDAADQYTVPVYVVEEWLEVVT